MSTAFKVMLVLICMSVLLGASSSQCDMPIDQQRDIEREILKVHSVMKKAAENLDADTLYNCVLDMSKGVIIENGKLFLTRKDSLDSTKQGLEGFKGLYYSYNQKYITVISPTSALWVAEGVVLATLEDGRKISSPFAESIVFVNKGGQWKVLHAHRSTPIQG